jgi:hypothetical protein
MDAESIRVALAAEDMARQAAPLIAAQALRDAADNPALHERFAAPYPELIRLWLIDQAYHVDGRRYTDANINNPAPGHVAQAERALDQADGWGPARDVERHDLTTTEPTETEET